MNSTERIWAALNHQPVDQLPTFSIGISAYFAANFYRDLNFTPQELERYSKANLFSNPMINNPMLIKVGFDGSWISFLAPYHFEAGQLVDTFGSRGGIKVVGNRFMYWYLGPYLDSEEKLHAWWAKGRPEHFPKSSFKSLRKQRDSLYNEANGFCLIVGIPGPFEPVSMGIGLGLLARLIRKKPELVTEILERNWEIQRQALREILATGQQIVLCGDDYGMNDGLLIQETHWRQFFKPVLARYVHEVHQAGAKFLLHSCGRIESIVPDIVEIGVDGIQSLQPLLNDLPKMKELYGDRLSLIGTIDDTRLLVQGTPDQIYKSVQDTCRVLGKNSGYIPGPTNFLGNIPLANIRSMMAAIHEFDPKS